MTATATRRAAALLASSFVIALASPGTALAADPPPNATAPAAAPAVSEADRLFGEGVTAQKAGKLPEAEALFLQAWALKKTWDIAANLGVVELKLGKLSEGAGHVAYAIANLPPTESDSTRESLTKALDAARPQLAEIRLACDVEGATVRVGDKLAGTTPLPASVFATPGQVILEVTKDGYEPARKTLDLAKGSAQDLKLALTKKAPPPEPSKLPAYIAFGVGGAGLVLGAITGGVSLAQFGDVKSACGTDSKCPEARRGDVDTGKTLAHVSTAGFVLAGLGAAAGVTLLLVPIGGKGPGQTSMVIGPGSLGVEGSF